MRGKGEMAPKHALGKSETTIL